MRTLLNIIKENIRWRKQTLILAKSDIVKTYSGAALGWFWAILKPTVTIFVLWFAFSIGLRQGGDKYGYPYILWIVSGMVSWFYMSEMITQGAAAIRSYRYLVTKMKFPVSTIPSFVALSKLFVHLCLVVIVIGIFTLFGFPPDRYLLQLPFYTILMYLFFVQWSLFSSMLSAVSIDFLNLVKSLTTAVFWMSGIMWDINTIGNDTLRVILKFNPVSFFATGYRNCFIYKKWFFENTEDLLCFAFVMVVMTLAAAWSYRKLIKEIPDVL